MPEILNIIRQTVFYGFIERHVELLKDCLYKNTFRNQPGSKRFIPSHQQTGPLQTIRQLSFAHRDVVFIGRFNLIVTQH
ncbi:MULTISPECIES: hypothetical protein [unclassified Methylophaga]|jgi:hypothetical protein|uniref:hypothetical protein n=1 Tax=unclassified Methylophaga TaxID=2629249 RepID=UPI000C90B750|nr:MULTISPECIES: hypothetical protein [unclassified Methylophaga]MAK66082.1 hypothetical protein [Methylophaga sp.]MAK68257.1 hypothetical protein [Methylophaga sp.]MAY17278.1 hypothetical protein [Methylophaga sp.]MBN45708.1 hypothetical protein [Methylophaga sp.]HAO24620.1 hypothetical protein [Methylophaga sp.]|tara:strand:- start:45595 stop:45831 length:237 start_codon:yes stop_codon:yes gene_type:complete